MKTATTLVFALLLSGCASTVDRPSSSAAARTEPNDGVMADISTRQEIDLAIVSVMSWWSLHKDGFKSCRMSLPGGDWRTSKASWFFNDPKSKGIAYVALNAEKSDYWWAVREAGNRGPWKITAPQEDGYTFEWSVGVGHDIGSTKINEVRIIFPIGIYM